MRRLMLVCARLAFVAAFFAVSVPALPLQVESAPSSQLLVELSRELSGLRRSTRAYGLGIRCGETVVRGIYLGKGLVAAPHIAKLERGTTGELFTSKGIFRLRALGSVGRSPESSPLVTFFTLAYPFDKVEPDLLAVAPRGWREAVGDLVLVRGRMRSNLAFALQSFGIKAERGAFSSQAIGATDDPYLHVLDMDEGDPGSLVVNAKGELVGMLLGIEVPARGPRPGTMASSPTTRETKPDTERKPDTAAKQNAVTKPEAATPVRITYGAIDVHWLRARAEHELGQALEPAPPSLGIQIMPDFRVQRVMLGSPAHDAGAKPGDQWVSINGVPLESGDQLLEAIRSGKKLSVSYRRQGVVASYEIKPH